MCDDRARTYALAQIATVGRRVVVAMSERVLEKVRVVVVIKVLGVRTEVNVTQVTHTTELRLLGISELNWLLRGSPIDLRAEIALIL